MVLTLSSLKGKEMNYLKKISIHQFVEFVMEPYNLTLKKKFQNWMAVVIRFMDGAFEVGQSLGRKVT